MRISKRGQEMSISTLVLIVLAIIVLVLVVIGFTGGWQNLSDRISNLGGGKENVQLVIQACEIACSSRSQYDYCTRMRDVNFGKGNAPAQDIDGDGKVKATCGALSGSPGIDLSCESFAATASCDDSGGRFVDDSTSSRPSQTCSEFDGTVKTTCDPERDNDVSSQVTGLNAGELCCKAK